MPITKSSLTHLLVLIFSILSLTPLSHSHPIGTLHTRNPNPRMIPTGNTDDLVNELVKTVGLDNLAKLDEWKDRNLRESSTPTANAPLDSSHVTYSGAGSYGGMQGTASELSDAGDDTSKLMAGLLRLVGDRVREAMLSRDERTLD